MFGEHMTFFDQIISSL